MAEMTNRIFVGGLDHDVDEMELSRQFKMFGEIEQVLLMRDRETQKSRGFGFISFRDTLSASDAIERMHGVEINGRPVSVRTAEREKSHSFRGGPRGSFRGGGRGRGGFRGSRGGGYNNRYDDRDNRSDRRFGSSQSYDSNRRESNYKTDYSSRNTGSSGYSGNNYRSNGRYNDKTSGSNYRSRSPAATRESAFYRDDSPVTASYPRDTSPTIRRRSNDFSSSGGRELYGESKGRTAKYSPPVRHGQYRSGGRDDYSPVETKRSRYRDTNRSPSPVLGRNEYVSTSYVPRSPPERVARRISPERNVSPPTRIRNMSPELIRSLSPHRSHRNTSPTARIMRTGRNTSPRLSPPIRKRNVSPSPPPRRNITGHRNMSPEYSPEIAVPVRDRSREITERVSSRTSRHATAGDSRSHGYAATESRMVGRTTYRSPREMSPVERKSTEGRYSRTEQARPRQSGRRY